MSLLSLHSLQTCYTSAPGYTVISSYPEYARKHESHVVCYSHCCKHSTHAHHRAPLHLPAGTPVPFTLLLSLSLHHSLSLHSTLTSPPLTPHSPHTPVIPPPSPSHIIFPSLLQLEWIAFGVMVVPTIGIPFFVWYQSHSKYESLKMKKA